jgi:hypothetical protein
MVQKKMPTHEIRLGAIRATLWANETASGDRWYVVTTSRSYKDDRGQWQAVHSYAKHHLSDLVKAIEAADQWIEQNSIVSQVEDLVAEPVVKALTKSPSKKRRAA